MQTQKQNKYNTQNIFYEADQFIVPETSLYDFFDYLAGQKINISEEKPLSQQIKITFRNIDTIPKKLNHKKILEQDHSFKPILLRQVNNELKKGTSQWEQLQQINFNFEQTKKTSNQNQSQSVKQLYQKPKISCTQRKNVIINQLSTKRKIIFQTTPTQKLKNL